MSQAHKLGVRKAPAAPEWDALFSEDDLKQEKQMSHAELRAAEQKKKKFLGIVRQEAPMDTIFRLWLLKRTVLPRLMHHPVVWLTIAMFVGSAAVRRWTSFFEGIEFDDQSDSGTLVTFMIVFCAQHAKLLC